MAPEPDDEFAIAPSVAYTYNSIVSAGDRERQDAVDDVNHFWNGALPDNLFRQDLHPRDTSDSRTVLDFQAWTKRLKTQLAMLARFVNAEKAVEYIETAYEERDEGFAWLTAEDVMDAIGKAEEDDHEEEHRPGTFWG